MVNKKTHKRRGHIKRRKIMKGGAYNLGELDILRNNNFTDYQIESLETLNISIDEVIDKINELINQGENQDDIPELVMESIMNENIFQNQNDVNIEPIQENEEDIHYLDDLNSSHGSSLHLSELDNISQNTTNPDESLSFISNDRDSSSSDDSFMSNESFGGKKRQRRFSKKVKKNKKGKKSKKERKSKKNRKSKKQRGGTCYGSGVGANNYDPNFSIHNTRELKLFPYSSS